MNTGWVHAPFARWATGELAEINPQQMTLVIRDDASKKLLLVRWNEETRLWIEPTRRDDRGMAFDASQIKPGAPIQIMFKKYSDHSLVTRVIRLALRGGPHKKITDGEGRTIKPKVEFAMFVPSLTVTVMGATPN